MTGITKWQKAARTRVELLSYADHYGQPIYETVFPPASADVIHTAKQSAGGTEALDTE